MDGYEQNPKLWDYDAAMAELRQEVRSTSKQQVDEQLEKCIGCMANRNVTDQLINQQAIATCGDFSVSVVNSGLARNAKSSTPLVQKRLNGQYAIRPVLPHTITTPENCGLLESRPARPTNELSISQRYLSAELLRCIGCIVQRNNGEVPPAMVTPGMFVDCVTDSWTVIGPVLRHLAKQDDAPVALDTSVTSIVRYTLTERAADYTSAPPAHCAKITGKLPKPAKPPEPPKPKKEARPKPVPTPAPEQSEISKPEPKPARQPKPIKLTKTVKQVKAARAALRKKQAAHPPVDLTKAKTRLPARARNKVTDALVATCLNCIANHRSDYVGLFASAQMLTPCTQKSRSIIQDSLPRLAATTDPPIYQKSPGSCYQLNPSAKNSSLPPTLPNCQFDQTFAASKAKSQSAAAKRRDTNMQLQNEVLQSQVAFITEPTARQHAEALLKSFIKRNILRIAIVHAPAPKTPAPSEAQRYTLVAGERLGNFTPAMQKAYFYAMGIDQIVYKQPTDVATLHNQLGLLPRDSVKALGKLVAYRLKYQREPVDIIDTDD